MASPRKPAVKKPAARKPVAKKSPSTSSRTALANSAARQRDIQRSADAKNESHDKPARSSTKKTAVQAGTRPQPVNPLPRQHQRKPGHEHQLDPQPHFLAPDYAGSSKLQGMVALITGGDSGIGRAVAVLFAREGADVAITYLCEHADAQTTCKHVEQEGARCIAIAGDVKDPAFCERVEELAAPGRRIAPSRRSTPSTVGRRPAGR